MSEPLRVIVVHPGAHTSTADVHNGLVAALRRRADLAVMEYALAGRIVYWEQILKFLYRRAKRADPQVERFNVGDVVKRASRELLELVWQCRAQWVIIVSGMFLHPDIIAQLRYFRAEHRIGILFTESPYDDERQIRIAAWADLLWTNERSSVLGLSQAGPPTFYLPHGIDPARHTPGPPDPSTPAHDVVFVGTAFYERIETLAAVDWTGIDLGLYGNWSYLGSRSKLRKYVKDGPIPNGYATDLYRAAKIGLNLHRSSMEWGKGSRRLTTAESLNPRAYELAGCGCFLISDYRPELPEIFGELVPTFKRPAELEGLVREWLANEPGRQVRRAALPAAVADHTWDRRAAVMVSQMQAAAGAELP